MGEARLAGGRLTDGVIEHRARVPYTIEEVDGADHLLVAFPAFVVDGSGAPPPGPALRRRLRDLKIHRLYVGSDEHFLIGPRNEWAGGRTATVLIQREAERLGVPLENVVAVGGSYRGCMALAIGLHARVGRIMAGACPVRIGYWGERMERDEDLPQVPAKEAGLAEKLLVADPEQQRRLDEEIVSTATASRHEADIFLFVSPHDRFFEDMRQLHDALEGHPTITSTLDVYDYGSHKGVGEPFHRRVRQRLQPIVGTTERPAESFRAPAG